MGSMVFECCVMSAYWKKEYQTAVCEMLRDWLISRMKLFGIERILSNVYQLSGWKFVGQNRERNEEISMVGCV